MVLYNAKMLAKQNIYHLEGKQITKLEGQTYQVKDGFFTTCGCEKGTPDWSISAKQMEVNVGQTGTAKGATFDVAGYPVIKLPYAIFPADSDRHSGFLSGREGQSGLRGFQWLQPYYIAINKSSDATVAFDVETSQRVGGLAEYRLSQRQGRLFVGRRRILRRVDPVGCESFGRRHGHADRRPSYPGRPLRAYRDDAAASYR